MNLFSIIGHVRYESDLSVDERSSLANFGKIGYTGLQSKTVLCCLFSHRTYDPNTICRVVKKARNLHYGDATESSIKTMYHSNVHCYLEACIFDYF